MPDLNTGKIVDYLSEYYCGGVEYRKGEFYLNGIKMSLDALAGVSFIKWLIANDKIDMDKIDKEKITGGVLRYILENYKGNVSIIEFLAPTLK